MGLIDKSALVTEIERKRNQEVQWMDRQGYTEYHLGLRDGYADILSFLDSLEVKEVDLEKEIELVKGDYEQVDVAWNNDFDFIAKHFFGLSLKAQKGE